MTNINDDLYSPITWGRDDDPDRSRSSPDRFRSRTGKLLAELETAIAPALEHYLFELNNGNTRHNIVSSIMEIMIRQDGIDEYRVVCDETNNSLKTIANHELVVDIWFRPKASIEFDYLRATLGESY